MSGTRLCATVAWEENDRPKQTLWFESNLAQVAHSPEAFLVGCAAPAMRDREKRVRVEDEVDPELLESVADALAYINGGYAYGYDAPALEASRLRQRPPRPAGRHAGMLSCGVDSLSMLRLNHARYAETHPRRISIGITVNGFDCVTPEHFETLWPRAVDVGQASGIEVLDLSTNISTVAQWPHPTRPFGIYSPREYEACILAAAAHSLSARISCISIGSTGVGAGNLLRRLHGSHPALDPLYGCSWMQVIHANATMFRLDKIRAILDWDAAMRNLMVCSKWHRTGLNCGLCGKCVRTTAEFIALGKLEESPFRGRRLTPAEILAVPAVTPSGAMAWKEVIHPLEAAGRSDLARAVKALLARERRGERIATLKERAKQADERYLGGISVRANRFARRILLPRRAES